MWPEKDVRDRRPGGARTSDRGAARRDRLPYFPPVYLLQAVDGPACARKAKGHPDHRRHPNYVSADSSDVWTHPELFKLKSDLSPKLVAGVPPDYYSPRPASCGAIRSITGRRTKKGRLRLVDLAHEEQYGAVRCRPSRPFPRFRGLLGGRRGRGHRSQRKVAQGPRHGAVPRHREGARPHSAHRRGSGRADR